MISHTLGLKMGPALKLFKAVEKEKADTQGSAGNGERAPERWPAQPAAPNPPRVWALRRDPLRRQRLEMPPFRGPPPPGRAAPISL